MHKFFYGNVGAKIKGLAMVGFFVEAIGAIITGVILMFIGLVDGDIEFLFYGFLSALFGPIVAWVSSWFIYAFGDIADNLRANRENTDYIAVDTDYMVNDIKSKRGSPKYAMKENEYFPNKYNADQRRTTENRSFSVPVTHHKSGEDVFKTIVNESAPNVNSSQTANVFIHNEGDANKVINESPKYCNRCGAALTSNICGACGTRVDIDNKTATEKSETITSYENIDAKKTKATGKFKQMVNDTSTEALMLILKTQRDSFSDEEIEIMANELRWRRGQE